jgi:hypothetical protein
MSVQHNLHTSAGLRRVRRSHCAEKTQSVNYGTPSKRLHFTNGTDAMIPQECQYCLKTEKKKVFLSELGRITNLSSITAICNIAWCTI